MDVTFEDLHWKTSDGKEVLKGISGRFRRGTLTGVLGPSGSGKTTLLGVLSGYKRSALHVRWRGRRRVYILQEDLLEPLLTARESIKLSAALKRAPDLRVDETLEAMGLAAVADTLAARLSGGERKRLSVALELVKDPDVLFLDEPTTGLDSVASHQCIDILKRVSKMGKTVICTVHQPSALSYALLDHVYVLNDGTCVYQGTSDDTVDYFAALGLCCPKYHNPADYRIIALLLEVASGEYGDYTCLLSDRAREQFKVAQLTDSDDDLCSSRQLITDKASCLKTILLLAKRTLIQHHRDWSLTYMKIVLHIFTSIFLGLNFIKSGSNAALSMKNASFFMIGIGYLTFATIMPALLRFPQEISIVKKEVFNDWYSLRLYYISSIVSNTPIQLLYTLLFSILSYLVTFQPLELDRICMYALAFMLAAVIAEATGHIIGSLLSTVSSAFIGSVVAGVEFLFSGCFIPLPHMSAAMKFFTRLSSMHYSFAAVTISVYGYGRKPLECPEEELYCHYRYPSTLLKEFSLENTSYWYCIAMLCAIALSLKVVAYALLKRKMKYS